MAFTLLSEVLIGRYWALVQVASAKRFVRLAETGIATPRGDL